MIPTGNNMKPVRSPPAKIPTKAPTGISRPKNRRHPQPAAASRAGFGIGNTGGMKPGKSLPPRDANEEVFALLRPPQEPLRHIATANQAAILNALPAHIALLDTRGRIISVNEAWRRFGSADVTQGPGCW